MGLTGLIPPKEGTHHDGTVSSLALGQQSRGVTLRELTAAYTAFFGGVRREAISYRRVLDREGRVLLENRPEELAREVLSPETAAIMTRLLVTVTEKGTAARYPTHTKAAELPVAGKTGTTQHACDRRFVGYTPRLLAGVWMGYDYPAELRGIRGNPCVTVWDELMALCESLYDGAPAEEDFEMPPTVTEAEFCPLSGCLPGAYCDHPEEGIPTERGWFRTDGLPRSVCPLHKEPPISVIPHDPTDPHRIPLLPNDVLPPPFESPPVLLPPKDSEPRGWGYISRWFSQFARERERRSGRSGNQETDSSAPLSE
jgi:penicillin-binding protein 1A